MKIIATLIPGKPGNVSIDFNPEELAVLLDDIQRASVVLDDEGCQDDDKACVARLDAFRNEVANEIIIQVHEQNHALFKSHNKKTCECIPGADTAVCHRMMCEQTKTDPDDSPYFDCPCKCHETAVEFEPEEDE